MTNNEKTKNKIIIVEDEIQMQNLIKPVLEKAGYEVFSAYDGEIALGMIEENKPDLVLLDLILPKKDGFEILEHLRSKEETRNLPVIIFTNLEEKYDIEKAISYGIRAYMVKTQYKPEEILSKINEILGK